MTIGASEEETNDEEEDDDEDEDEDDEDEDEGLRRRALPVEGEPDYASGPPMDGFEYLRRVAHEARKTPNVMRATDADERARASATERAESSRRRRDVGDYFGDDEEALAPPPWATPDGEWVRRTIGDFSDLRVRISRTLASRDSAPGARSYPSTADRRSWLGVVEDVGDPPLGALLAMDAVICAYLLRQLSHRLQTIDLTSGRTPAGDAELTRLLRWFFATCARADLPLDADTVAAIRSAMKSVARVRLTTTSELDALVPHLNLAIAIGGGYFKQWRST